MQRVITSELETEKRIFTFPTSQIKLNGKKSSYYDIIHSMAFPECNQALRSVFRRINMADIFTLINETPLITDTHKAFYRHMLQARYEKIIKSAYDALDRRV